MDPSGLIAAICANPDDDTARLAYADWLEEQPSESKRCETCRGTGWIPASHLLTYPYYPHATGTQNCEFCDGTGSRLNRDSLDRAEFIRIQIERERRRSLGMRIDDEERLLRDRESHLSNTWYDQWVGDLTRLSGVSYVDFKRGFAHRFWVHAAAFCGLPFDDVFAKHPIESIRVREWGAYLQQISATIPKQLRILEIDESVPFSSSDVYALASFAFHHGWIETLQEITVGDNCTLAAHNLLQQTFVRQRLRIGGTLLSAVLRPEGMRVVLKKREGAAVAPEIAPAV